MPSLKEFRNRIASVKSTQKITKAMQMVAAAKLKRAQSAAEAARPYASRMARVIANLAAAVSGDDAPLLLRGTGKDQTHLLVVATSERGLCGGFNTQIVRMVRERIGELQRAGKTVKILVVGKKGRDQLRRTYGPLIVKFIDLSGYRTLDGTAAQQVGQVVTDMYAAGEFDVATLFFLALPFGDRANPHGDANHSRCRARRRDAARSQRRGVRVRAERGGNSRSIAAAISERSDPAGSA